MMRPSSHRVQILRYRPRQRLVRRLVVVVALFAALSLSYWLGGLAAMSRTERSDSAQAELASRMQECSEKLEQFQQQVMNLSKGSEIDAVALAQARTESSSAKAQIERLEQEVALYQSLIDGSVRTGGISIQGLDIKRVSPGAGGRYRYRLTFMQRAKQHVEVKGYATVTVSGMQAEKPRALPLPDSLGAEPRSRLALKFVYFQMIEREFELPEGFEPAEVRVQAEIRAGRVYKIDRSFDWTVTED